MIFELRVWFRYMVAGEQEKDFFHYEVDALNVHEAFKFIKQKYFKTQKCIPISYERIINGKSDGKVYKPSHVDRNDVNFEKPISNLNKEY